MYTATRNGPSTSAPGDSSRTLTITNNPTREENGDERGDDSDGGQLIGTLRLRTTRLTGPRVAWDENVIDNEGFGKKKSKSKCFYFHRKILIQCVFFFNLRSVCCIYHKARRFDESSSDESSSESDSDSCSHHDHDHTGHNHNHRLNPSGRGSSSSNPQQGQRSRGIVHESEILDDTQSNAYETQPESKKGKRKASAFCLLFLSIQFYLPRD